MKWTEAAREVVALRAARKKVVNCIFARIFCVLEGLLMREKYRFL